MAKWWRTRLIWLALGLLPGAIAIAPEGEPGGAAAAAGGALTLVYIGAWLVILGRVGVAVVRNKSGAKDAVSLKSGVLWDVVFFLLANGVCLAFLAK